MVQSLPPPEGTAAATPFPADCAEKFECVEKIASGGFGAVYLARHRPLGHTVAVKLLLADVLEDKDQIERFNQEARITASLAHPNIVKVFDHGAGTGTPWIAYEFVEGRTVREALATAPSGFPAEQALAIAIDVAAGLEEAHAQGVIHRDIKPDNVLEVTEGHHKVLDFGIAKWLRRSGVKTRTGLILGTPGYLAPEVIVGDAAPSPLVDVYALGVMLFELLTGQLPFREENAFLLLRHHLETPAPSLETIRPGLPVGVSRIVRTALQKDPLKRYASAGAMRDEMVRVLVAASRCAPSSPGGRGRTAGDTVPVNRMPVPVRVGAARHRQRWTASGLAAMAVLIALGARWPHGGSVRSTETPTAAIRPDGSRSVSTAPVTAAPVIVPREPDLRGTWRWSHQSSFGTPTTGRWVLTWQKGGTFSGRFTDDDDSETGLIEGTIEGGRVVVHRRWSSKAAPRQQTWRGVLRSPPGSPRCIEGRFSGDLGPFTGPLDGNPSRRVEIDFSVVEVRPVRR